MLSAYSSPRFPTVFVWINRSLTASTKGRGNGVAQAGGALFGGLANPVFGWLFAAGSRANEAYGGAVFWAVNKE